MMISKAARVAALLVGGSVLLAATPALAQRTPDTSSQRRAAQQARQNQQAQPAQPGQRRFNLSRPEQAALTPLEQAVQAAQAAGASANWAAAQALLPAARAAARGDDARYFVAKFEYAIAVGTNSLEGQEAALTALAGNPSTPADEATRVREVLARLPHIRAERAFNAGDFAAAERIYRQILQTNPNDTLAQNNLRVTLSRTGNTAGSLELIEQQIRAAEANGGRATEEQYRQAYALASRANQRAAAATALQRLLRAYPTSQNLRTAVDVARGPANQDTQLLLDIYRFARVAGVLQANEYMPLVNTLSQASLSGEAKAVIDAGIAARSLTATQADVVAALRTINPRLTEDRTGLDAEIRQARSAAGTARQARNIADALFGYGRHAEAAELYRVALTKGGEDANLLNTRLGAALALAGQRAAAETALRAVTGSRAELAALWLAWLARTPA